jgi:hypothetical protein
MFGFNRWQLFLRFAAVLCVIGVTSLALIYFIPAPPAAVTMATAFKGTSFGYYGGRYRDSFARSGVKLELRETTGNRGESRSIAEPELRRSDCIRVGRHFQRRATSRTELTGDYLQYALLGVLLIERAAHLVCEQDHFCSDAPVIDHLERLRSANVFSRHIHKIK